MHNVEKYYSGLGAANDQDNLQNIKWLWSENEYFMQYMLNYKPEDRDMKAAAGL